MFGIQAGFQRGKIIIRVQFALVYKFTLLGSDFFYILSVFTGKNIPKMGQTSL